MQVFSFLPCIRSVCKLGNFRCFVVGFQLPRSSLRGVTTIEPLPQMSQILDIVVIINSGCYNVATVLVCVKYQFLPRITNPITNIQILTDSEFWC